MLQQTSWLITIILVTLLAIIFLFIASSAAKSKEDYAPVQKSAYLLRTKLFVLSLLVLIPIIGYSLTKLPYDITMASNERVKIVTAVGHQWYWELSDMTASVKEDVIYKVTSADVNHGFAIYNADLEVIAQTQAMPTYTNELRVRYPKPGRYKILCLEYCGLAHHVMSTEITVSP